MTSIQICDGVVGLDGPHTPEQLQVAQQYGRYENRFFADRGDVDAYLTECRARVPTGWRLEVYHWGRDLDRVPVTAIRVGQYRIRTGDPENPMFLIPA